MIYLDHNATTPVRPEVAEAMSRATTDLCGNPSSIHAAGRRAREAVERARARVATFLGVTAEEIVFSSGGTEGDNLAIRGLAVAAAAAGRHHVVTSPLEHPAVHGALDCLREGTGTRPGFTIGTVRVSARGEIEPSDLETALREDTGLATLSLANHELGNLYPIAALAAVAHSRNVLFHTDAVQAAGKVPLDLTALNVDAATISAHKIGGPKGVGAVFVRRGLDLPPVSAGGHQERGRRPGTENVVGIVGFGLACELAGASLAAEADRLRDLRQRLRRALAGVPDVRFFGVCGAGDRAASGDVTETMTLTGAGDRMDQTLPGTMMVGFSGAPGQLVAIGLDLEGICVSTGAACASGSLEPSPVLRALGLPAGEAGEGVRISLGWTTTASDVDRLGDVLPAIVERVRAATSASASASILSAAAASMQAFSHGGAA